MAKSENQIVNFYSEENPATRRVISTLAVQIHEYKKKYDKTSILLTGCSASNGTTMIAINLAVYLAQAGMTTLLVDADMRTAVKHDNRIVDRGLSDVLSGQYGEIRHTNIENMYFMPSGRPLKDPALLMCKDSSAEFFKRTAEKFDFVIIDCPAVTIVPEALTMFSSVDGVLLICSLEKTTKKQLQAAKNVIEPYAKKYYGLVVNSVDAQQYRSLFPNSDYYEKKKKREVIKDKFRNKVGNQNDKPNGAQNSKSNDSLYGKLNDIVNNVLSDKKDR
ncbi:MAG: CpsD/CapB family tyrosine-protein kinase [Oscillospiraceae bacterium]|nr:CpsD/CapB family tyrosine-protein kinase [Oscillospiraceae bacterium]